MERVQAHLGVRAALADRDRDPVGHVAGDELDLFAAVFAQQIQELVDRLLVAAGVRPHQPAAVVVDHYGQVSLAFADRDLIHAQALEPGEQVALCLGLGGDALADPADRPPRDPHQLRDRRLARVHRQPGGLVLEAAREPGVVPGPRHRRDHHPVTLAAHARRVGFKEAQRRAEIERPPPTAPFALVIARAAPPAMWASVNLSRTRVDRHHQHPVALVELDLLDHRSPQPEQRLPYPEWAHVATAPFTSVPALRSQNRRSPAACALSCPDVGRSQRPDLIAPKRGRRRLSSSANPRHEQRKRLARSARRHGAA